MNAASRTFLSSALLLMSWVGISSANAIPAPSKHGGPYLITGTDMGPLYNHVYIAGFDGDQSGAIVTLNGMPLATGDGWVYSGQLPVELAAGEALNLRMEVGAEVVTATGVVPEPPLIIQPLEGDSFSRSDDILVEWSCGTNPDRFVISAQYSGTAKYWAASGFVRRIDIPATELPYETSVNILVYSYTDGVFTGPYDEDSNMNIRGSEWAATHITVPVDGRSWAHLKALYR